MTCIDCIHKEACTFSSVIETANHCRHYEDKSHFVELPCKVGDKIYMIAGSGDEAFIADGRVKSIIFESECVWIYSIYDCGLNYHTIAGTGDHFFTKEEAEKKLQEINK